MKVHLRNRKQTKNGTISQYLEYYLGTTINSDGTHKVKRQYEYLDLPLIDKPKLSETEKEKNRANKELALKILTDRQNSINHQEYGFLNQKSTNLSFTDYFKNYIANEKPYDIYKSSFLSFQEFTKGTNIKFKDFDFGLYKEFVYYLLNKKQSYGISDRPIKPKTVKNYLTVLHTVLKKSYNENLFPNYLLLKKQIDSNNPFPKVPDTDREYLTLDEIKLLSKSYLKKQSLKTAFLFSCLTGLRISDIKKMKWSEIQKDGENYKYVFYSKKTGKPEHLHLNKQAIELLGVFGKPDENVFDNLYISSYDNKVIHNWVKANGIQKHITFHCARHTFATLQLTLGTDIVVVSKLLGHSNINTTMIYAKIIDERKVEAMNKIPDLGINF